MEIKAAYEELGYLYYLEKNRMLEIKGIQNRMLELEEAITRYYQEIINKENETNIGNDNEN